MIIILQLTSDMTEDNLQESLLSSREISIKYSRTLIMIIKLQKETCILIDKMLWDQTSNWKFSNHQLRQLYEILSQSCHHCDSSYFLTNKCSILIPYVFLCICYPGLHDLSNLPMNIHDCLCRGKPFCFPSLLLDFVFQENPLLLNKEQGE